MRLKLIPTTISALLCVTGLISAQGPGQGQGQNGDPISRQLVPPPLIFEKAPEIDLTPEQRDKVKELVQQTHRKNTESREVLQKRTKALAAELAKTPIDTKAALRGLDEVLELEGTMKRLQFEMMVAVNNQLKPGQRAALLSMMRGGRPGDLADEIEKRLKGKIRQLEEIAQAMAAKGQSPDQIHEMMKAFSTLMETGKVDRAEELLDRTLQKLRGEDESSKPEKGTGKGAAIDPAALRREIEAMRVKDVAWRKIAWKTCLLDGLKASREQNKPMVLWVFIDRPIDDKRC